MIKLTFIVFAIALSSSVSAGETLKFITIDVAPWASNSPDGKSVQGVFPEVIDELEQRTGFEIVVTLTPFARIQRELESSRQDCTILASNSELQRITDQGEIVSTHAMGVIARKGIKLESREDLSKLTISVLRGSDIAADVNERLVLKKEFDTNYLIGLRKLSHMRLDAIFGALPTIRHLADQENLSKYLGDSLVLEEIPLLLQCSKKSSKLALMPALNKAIRQMHEDGTLDEIKKEFFFE